MVANGVRFQPSLGGTLHLSRTNAFFLGGGKALVNAYYRTAASIGIEVAYDTEVCDLDIRDGRFHSAMVLAGGAQREIRAKVMVAASGGFESNIPWLKDALGTRGRELPHSRHAVQPGEGSAGAPRPGREIDRRPDAVPRGGDRRAFAEVRRRHLHPRRLRVTGDRRQPARAALLRRRRGFLAEALRDLGTARRRPARSDRVLDHRFKGRRKVHAAGVRAGEGGLDPRARALARARPGGARGYGRSVQRRGTAGHFQPRRARRLRDRGDQSRRRRTGRARSTRPHSSATRCGPASPSPISASG